MEINEKKIADAVSDQVINHLIDQDNIHDEIRNRIQAKVDAIFADRADKLITSAVDAAVKAGFDLEYSRVDQWGKRQGEATTIRKELERMISVYWAERVDQKSGKPSDSNYSSISRAEYLMTQICAEDFSKAMMESALNITGALKDGLRNQMGKQLDILLGGLFKVKSLQDQGKVDKPY